MPRKNQRVHIGIVYHHISQYYRLLGSSNFTPVHVISFPSLVQTLVWVGEWCILDLCGVHCWGFVADSLALLRRFGVLVGRKDALVVLRKLGRPGVFMEVSWNVTFLKSGSFFVEVSKAFQKMPCWLHGQMPHVAETRHFERLYQSIWRIHVESLRVWDDL